jgi:hypothetical protein
VQSARGLKSRESSIQGIGPKATATSLPDSPDKALIAGAPSANKAMFVSAGKRPGSRVCDEGLRRFPAEDDLMTENRRRALAESYFELGETGKAEALYRDCTSVRAGDGAGSGGRMVTNSRAPS